MKGKRNAKKYPYKGKMLQMGEILALPECTKSRTCIMMHLKKGKSLEEIFAIEVAPVKAKKIKKNKAKEAKAKAKAAEKERIKKIMSVPINPKYTQEFYMKKTIRKDNEVEPMQLKQNAFTIGY